MGLLSSVYFGNAQSRSSAVLWFGDGKLYSPGRYLIKASGWYTHWNESKPNTVLCDVQDAVVACCNFPKTNPGMKVRVGTTDTKMTTVCTDKHLSDQWGQGDFEVLTESKIGVWNDDDVYGDNLADATYKLYKHDINVGDNVLCLPGWDNIWTALKGCEPLDVGNKVRLYPSSGGAKVAIKEEWLVNNKITIKKDNV